MRLREVSEVAGTAEILGVDRSVRFMDGTLVIEDLTLPEASEVLRRVADEKYDAVVGETGVHAAAPWEDTPERHAREMAKRWSDGKLSDAPPAVKAKAAEMGLPPPKSEPAKADKPKADKPKADKPKADKKPPKTEKPKADKPKADKPPEEPESPDGDEDEKEPEPTKARKNRERSVDKDLDAKAEDDGDGDGGEAGGGEADEAAALARGKAIDLADLKGLRTLKQIVGHVVETGDFEKPEEVLAYCAAVKDKVKKLSTAVNFDERVLSMADLALDEDD